MHRFELDHHSELVAVEKVTSEARLEELCQSWLEQEVLALDTEFDRTNTFFHKLALIQVYDGEEIYLLDPLQLKDLSALGKVLSDASVLKVLHSCSEDLEALHNTYNFPINSIFDTQIAAALVGLGPMLGYGNMVEQMLGLTLDKEHTKTDWLKRPLSEEQKVYAAQDVQFLLPCFYKLRESLLEKGHYGFVLEDTESIYQAITHLEDFEHAYLKVKGAFKLKPSQLNRLRKVAAWREQLARREDIPKTFIFRDHHLLDICMESKPTTSFLLKIGCNRGSIRKYGAELLNLIAEADAESKTLWPEAIPAFHKLPGAKQKLKALKVVASTIAKENDIPEEAISSKRLLEYYIKTKQGFITRPNHFWNSWRRELLEPAFKAKLEELS
ncbi:Ribonuclease D [Kangiella sediminilitoris]|uniref:Ribonuclease D n=1 Tax=Kangiella sediminilitoris TaxID=1144748 RepID=A0A1B3BAR6_9GAMM|nr:Ribonuclease D [Kangiella sediminilitoris]